MNAGPADVRHDPCYMLPHLGHLGEQRTPAIEAPFELLMDSNHIAWLEMLRLVRADDQDLKGPSSRS